MVEIVSFNPSGHYISTDIKYFNETIIDMINMSSQTNLVELNTLVFKSNKPFDPKNVNLAKIAECGIPVMDLIIYLNLSEADKAKVFWKVEETNQYYTESQIGFCLMTLYFMVMTRNKSVPDSDERLPEFTVKFMRNQIMTIKEIKACLSNNNLNLFVHTWVKKVPLARLSLPLKNRLKQGIVGMRLYNVICNNEPDRDLDAHTLNLIDNIKAKMNDGPYWEMHTIFQSSKLASMSISANLNNLILDMFSVEKLEMMVKSKMLFKMPKYNVRAVSYKSWSADYLNEYKTKMIFE